MKLSPSGECKCCVMIHLSILYINLWCAFLSHKSLKNAKYHTFGKAISVCIHETNNVDMVYSMAALSDAFMHRVKIT